MTKHTQTEEEVAREMHARIRDIAAHRLQDITKGDQDVAQSVHNLLNDMVHHFHERGYSIFPTRRVR